MAKSKKKSKWVDWKNDEYSLPDWFWISQAHLSSPTPTGFGQSFDQKSFDLGNLDGDMTPNWDFDLKLKPTDNYFDQQWALQNGGIADINLGDVWQDYTGRGVSVGVFDTGVDYNHRDLDNNYSFDLQAQFLGGPVDGNHFDPDGQHGTAVAGIIAAERDGQGTVGVAYDATISSIPMISDWDNNLDGVRPPPPLFGEFAMANFQRFDIANNSWGSPNTFGESRYDSANDGFHQAIDDAVALGRGGLGTIIVAGAGNDRGTNRNTNDSDWLSNPNVINVASINQTGFVSFFSTEGASILVSAPGEDIVTTDRSDFGLGYNNFWVPTTPSFLDTNYATFLGTSAAAPHVSGLVALMLEANPDLGFRDVQQILAYSAVHTGSPIGGAPLGNEKYPWIWNAADTWNGGGLHYSNDYGFGLIDAHAAVRLAETWSAQSTAASRITPTWIDSVPGTMAVPDDNVNGLDIDIDVNGNRKVESIALEIDMVHTNVQDLRITLTSPDGTTGLLWNGNLTTEDWPGKWTLDSEIFRGEMSLGTWTVNIQDLAGGNVGTVNGVSLQTYTDRDQHDDIYVYTDELSEYAGNAGHGGTLVDTDGGADTINAAALTSDSIIDLNQGATNEIDGHRFELGAVTLIENAVGGDGDDSLTGNRLANDLFGGRGRDDLTGGEGGDLLDGGEGRDTAHYEGATAAVAADLQFAGILNQGEAAGDSYTSIENLSGSGYGDWLGGDDVNNTLWGRGGIDTLLGRGGSDFLYGGADDDVLIGGAGGDKLDGGSGNDSARYESAVVVNLSDASQNTGDAAGDTFISIERLYGSGFDDTLIGDAGNNYLFGEGGEDILKGGRKADHLYGGYETDHLYGGQDNDHLWGNEGTDKLWGDSGSDVFHFADGDGFDIINDFEQGPKFWDKIDVTGYGFTRFKEVAKYMTDTDGGVRVNDLDGDDGVTILGFKSSDLSQEDFLF